MSIAHGNVCRRGCVAPRPTRTRSPAPRHETMKSGSPCLEPPGCLGSPGTGFVRPRTSSTVGSSSATRPPPRQAIRARNGGRMARRRRLDESRVGLCPRGSTQHQKWAAPSPSSDPGPACCGRSASSGSVTWIGKSVSKGGHPCDALDVGLPRPRWRHVASAASCSLLLAVADKIRTEPRPSAVTRRLRCFLLWQPRHPAWRPGCVYALDCLHKVVSPSLGRAERDGSVPTHAVDSLSTTRHPLGKFAGWIPSLTRSIVLLESLGVDVDDE